VTSACTNALTGKPTRSRGAIFVAKPDNEALTRDA
jgi:hypothetical protein